MSTEVQRIITVILPDTTIRSHVTSTVDAVSHYKRVAIRIRELAIAKHGTEESTASCTLKSFLLALSRSKNNRAREWLGNALCWVYQFIRSVGATICSHTFTIPASCSPFNHI